MPTKRTPPKKTPSKKLAKPKPITPTSVVTRSQSPIIMSVEEAAATAAPGISPDMMAFFTNAPRRKSWQSCPRKMTRETSGADAPTMRRHDESYDNQTLRESETTHNQTCNFWSGEWSRAFQALADKVGNPLESPPDPPHQRWRRKTKQTITWAELRVVRRHVKVATQPKFQFSLAEWCKISRQCHWSIHQNDLQPNSEACGARIYC